MLNSVKLSVFLHTEWRLLWKLTANASKQVET